MSADITEIEIEPEAIDPEAPWYIPLSVYRTKLGSQQTDEHGDGYGNGFYSCGMPTQDRDAAIRELRNRYPSGKHEQLHLLRR